VAPKATAPGPIWRRVWAGARTAFAEFWNAEPMTLAASIAFYTALSFAPIVVLAIAGLSLLGPGQEAALVTQVSGVFGRQVGGAVEMVIENVGAGGFGPSVGGVIAFVALLVSATSAFAQLQEALNEVWGIELPDKNVLVSWLRRRLFSLGILAVVGFLLVAALIVSTVLAVLLTREGILWLLLNEALTLLVLGLAFAALYRFVPDRVPPWRGALVGGAITAVLFETGKWALGSYLGSTTSDDAYGAASALILLLLWVYYSSLIVLVGAFLTRLIAQRRGWILVPRRPVPLVPTPTPGKPRARRKARPRRARG
jgi:membrane protein